MVTFNSINAGAGPVGDGVVSKLSANRTIAPGSSGTIESFIIHFGGPVMNSMPVLDADVSTKEEPDFGNQSIIATFTTAPSEIGDNLRLRVDVGEAVIDGDYYGEGSINGIPLVINLTVGQQQGGSTIDFQVIMDAPPGQTILSYNAGDTATDMATNWSQVMAEAVVSQGLGDVLMVDFQPPARIVIRSNGEAGLPVVSKEGIPDNVIQQTDMPPTDVLLDIQVNGDEMIDGVIRVSAP